MLKLGILFVVAYLILLAIVFFNQERLLYLPNTPGRELTARPADIGLDYEDVSLEADGEVTLHGWFIGGSSPRVLLFFHGNAGNISHRLPSIRQFHELGLSVLIVDYRGYGASSGEPGEAGMYRDAEAAWRYLTATRNVVPDDIVVFGRSLGGSVAARLAAQERPGALIVESAFTSVPDVAQEAYPWLPARWLSRMRHSTREFLKDVRCPVLVVHGRSDSIVPFHHGERLFEAANEPRTFLALDGGHNDAFVRDETNYLAGVRSFLSGLDGTKDDVL